MKKQINEPEYIGGIGHLTKEEENSLSQYFRQQKARKIKTSELRSERTKSHETVDAG